MKTITIPLLFLIISLVQSEGICASAQTLTSGARFVAAHNNRGLAHYKKGKFDEAVYEWNKALKLDPKNAKVHNNLGLIYHLKADSKEALFHFTQAVMINPKYVEAFYNRAMLRRDMNDLAGAVEDWELAIKTRPDYAEAYLNCGAAYKNMGKTDKALEAYSKAIQIRPAYPKALHGRSVIYFLKREKKNCFEDLLKAKQLGYPIDPKYVTQVQNLPD